MNGKNTKKYLAVFEMFLMISLSFAIAFIWSEEVGIVSGDNVFAGADPGINLPSNQVVEQQPSITQAPACPPSVAPAGAANSFLAANVGKTVTVDGVTGVLGQSGGQYTLTAAGKTTVIADPSKISSFSAGGAGGAGGGTGGGSSILGNLFGGQAFGGGMGGALFSGVVWAAAVGGLLYFAGKMFGMTPNNAKALGYAGAAAGGIGSTMYLMGSNQVFSAATNSFLMTWGPIIGIGVGVAVFVFMYKKEKVEIYTFECMPWEPPLGGARCQECNKDPMKPCSEYRCKALGQACGLVNQGSENEMCVSLSKDDVTAPIITPLKEALKPTGLDLVPDNTISPPNTGVKIVYKTNRDKCLKPFTKLTFGINTTNEPSQCRIDWNPGKKFDDMTYLMGESNYYDYTHIQTMKVPTRETGTTGEGDTAPVIGKDGTFTLWVRCRDGMGNENAGAFAFKFCVDPAPDSSPPIVEGLSIEDGSPVKFNAENVPIEVYVDKPAECKWSKIDKAYKDMENNMSCMTETYQINAKLQYVCSGELNGIVNRQDNNFYFRCKSYPGKQDKDRFEMTTSKKLTLRGSQELAILGTGPNETIKGSTDSWPVALTVETGFGSNDGEATCTFSDKKEEVDRNPMDFTGGVDHNQTIYLNEGSYIYYFRCVDAGGNSVESNTTFSVYIDRQKPVVARVYRDNDKLKVITTEDSVCKYSLTSCNFNFDDGLQMGYEDANIKNVQIADWTVDKTYYIKCEDPSGNRPAPTACSVVARGSDL